MGREEEGNSSAGADKERQAAGSYEKMTRAQMYEAARAKGFKRISRFTKAQLLDLLRGKIAAPAPADRRKSAARKPKASRFATGPGEPEAPEKVETGDAPYSGGVAAGTPEGVPASPGEPQSVYVDWGYPLPEEYKVDKIGAFAKDPNWVFVYWDLSGNRREEVAQSHGPDIFNISRWHLRVRDLSCDDYVDFPISVNAKNWYIPVSEDKTFKVEIGLLTPEGDFIPFAATAEIRTPRSRPSDNVSEQWMIADKKFQQFLQHVGDIGGEISSGNLARRARDTLRD